MLGRIGTLPNIINGYRVPLLTNTGKNLLPSAALLLAMKQWGMEAVPIQLLSNNGFEVGNIAIETDTHLSVLHFFIPNRSASIRLRGDVATD
ncbi:MAG: hypothetical protein R3E08_12600 [Thiotrichaceae bacterium]